MPPAPKPKSKLQSKPRSTPKPESKAPAFSPRATRSATAQAAPSSSRRRPRAGEPSSRAALTPETWIDAATEVLVDRGIDHVRVDVLAGELGVTRGSFYWHFRDREDLLRRVLQAWRERATEALTQRLLKAGSDPRAQLRDVISLPHRGRAAERAARIELAIRAWARRDPTARAAVDEADAQRLGYHEQILRTMGFDAEQARLRAFAVYGLEVAESLLGRQHASTRAQRQAFIEALALTPTTASA